MFFLTRRIIPLPKYNYFSIHTLLMTTAAPSLAVSPLAFPWMRVFSIPGISTANDFDIENYPVFTELNSSSYGEEVETVERKLERELIPHAQLELETGDRSLKAVRQLIKSQKPVIGFWAYRFAGRNGVTKETLVRVGENVLAEKAIPKFDPARGTNLTTYAKKWYHSTMDRYVREEALFPVSQYTYEARQRISRWLWNYEKNEATASAPEIAEGTGLSLKRVANALKNRPLSSESLSDPVYDEGRLTLEELLPSGAPLPDENLITKDMAKVLEPYLRAISPLERTVVWSFAVNDNPLGNTKRDLIKIGKKLGLKPKDMRNIYNSAINKLKAMVKKENVPSPYYSWLHDYSSMKKIVASLTWIELELFGMMFVMPVSNEEIAKKFEMPESVVRALRRSFEIYCERQCADASDVSLQKSLQPLVEKLDELLDSIKKRKTKSPFNLLELSQKLHVDYLRLIDVLSYSPDALKKTEEIFLLGSRVYRKAQHVE